MKNGYNYYINITSEVKKEEDFYGNIIIYKKNNSYRERRTDIIIDALTSDEKEKKDIYKTEDFLAENSKREREALKRFVSLYKK